MGGGDDRINEGAGTGTAAAAVGGAVSLVARPSRASASELMVVEGAVAA